MNNLPMIFDGKSVNKTDISNVVYLWTRNNIPCYIGVTKKSVYKRCQEHLTYKKDPQLFQNKLRQHKSDFRCYILAQEFDYKKLLELEIKYIKEYNTYNGDNINGYNLTKGGENRDFTEETRRKIGNASKGRTGYWNNKTFTKEHKDKLSAAKVGIVVSEETKNLKSKILKNKYKNGYIHPMAGKKLSNDTLLKKSAAMKIYWANKKQSTNEVTY